MQPDTIENGYFVFTLMPSLYCHLNCPHCYLSVAERRDRTMLSPGLIEEACRKIDAYWNGRGIEKRTVVCYWYGGEPTSMGIPAFRDLVERIYVEMTTRSASVPAGRRTEYFPGTGIGTILPHVSSNSLSGLLEAVAAAPYNGEADLPVIASSLHMEIDELFPVAETLQMLRFAEVAGGDIRLTTEGRQFADFDTDRRKHLFARHLLTYVALAAHIRRVLDERPVHQAPWSRFADELEDYMPPAAAVQTLRTIIALGRYAEIFSYDDEKQVFSLDNP